MPEKDKFKATDKLDLVVFTLDNEEYAALVEDVKEVIKSPEINPIPSSPKYVLGFMNLRGTVVSVLDMEKRFNLQRNSKKSVGSMVMIIDSGESPFGIMVDEVTEVLSVNGDSVQKTPKNIVTKIGEKYIYGIILVDKAVAKDKVSNDEITSISDEVEKRALLLVNLKELLNKPENQ